MSQKSSSISAAESALKCELAAEVLRSFGQLRFAATGWSMLPSIFPGETLIVERVNPDQVRIGDVVLVKRERGLRAHRVVGEAGNPTHRQWITQGDALPVQDRPVAGNELLGRITYLIRAGKRIAMPSMLTAAETLTAMMIQRSRFAARAVICLNRMRKTSQKSVLSCQG